MQGRSQGGSGRPTESDQRDDSGRVRLHSGSLAYNAVLPWLFAIHSRRRSISLYAAGFAPKRSRLPRLRRDSDGGSGVLLGLPASERLVRFRLRWVHDLLENAGVGGQLTM